MQLLAVIVVWFGVGMAITGSVALVIETAATLPHSHDVNAKIQQRNLSPAELVYYSQATR